MKTYAYIVAWAVIATLAAAGLAEVTGWNRETILLNIYGATWAYLAFEVRDRRRELADLRERHARVRNSAMAVVEAHRG